jgi:hypothetical protein
VTQLRVRLGLTGRAPHRIPQRSEALTGADPRAASRPGVTRRENVGEASRMFFGTFYILCV